MHRSHKKSYLIFIFGLTLFYFSCKKETIPVYSTSYNYFPTQNGNWVEYSVDSVYHSENDNNNDDSVYHFHYYVREEIDSSFIDGSGRVNQVLKRFRRTDSTYAWVIQDVWTQSLSPAAAYKTEDNVPFHKLSFPINAMATWNGNDANTLEEEMYIYDLIHQPYDINNLHFDSTISVIQVDENNFVETLFGTEVYAANIGLVFKEREDLYKRNGIVVSGLEFRMEAIRFGKN